ncbi:unnamed protein product [Clavelina lepadiformis]|uniref:Uncharacterized protein n=1 Tax=Clavelina lepadiformis TaxID=159417 RepID=A0ABP0GX45_CLALP
MKGLDGLHCENGNADNNRKRHSNLQLRFAFGSCAVVFQGRNDVAVWVLSMIFVLAWLGAMWGWGLSKSWGLKSGYHNMKMNQSLDRFLPEPFDCNETSIEGRFGEDCVSLWYFWKLPPDKTTVLSHAMVWLLYSLHQIFVWGLLYRAQLLKSQYSKSVSAKKYSCQLLWFNWALLLVNGLFHVLHLIQTHWTYDALAQDVAMSSSQGSVIMMLCFILLIEYRERGVVLMWPNPGSDDRFAKYLRLNPEPIHLIRKYHGYAFSWACIYTFWYHPMENTWGHTLGFFHTAMVLLQGSLIFTEIHLNKYWRLLIEVWVLVHGTFVAVQTESFDLQIWPVFAFGFGFILAFTQIFGLPFWKKISPYFRLIPVILFFVIVLALSGTLIIDNRAGKSGLGRMYEMLFIPAVEKSPGPDGISAEFYKIFWPMIGDKLTEIYQSWFDKENIHDDIKKGLETLIFLNGDRANLDNYIHK